jgi:hypothetical protein
MPNAKAQISNQIQITKESFSIWTFVIDLTFRFWHLNFQFQSSGADG